MTESKNVVLITGATRGIGRSYATALAARGWRVAVTGRGSTDDLVRSIEAEGGTAIGASFDIADAAKTAEFADQVIEGFGRIDAVINNAAYFSEVPHVPVEQVDPEDVQRAVGVNLGGILNTSRALVPHFKARGSGRIINVSSTTVFLGTPEFLPYVATKSAIIGVTRALARELAPHGVLVNTITPGFTVTLDIDDPGFNALRTEFRERRALQRDATPADLVGTIEFLLSDASSFVTGQNIVVDGGDVLH